MPSEIEVAPTLVSGYAGAVDHYTSASRRDAVKQRWEEPELVRLLETAVTRARPGGPLRIADIGCGTGVGLELLRTTPSLSRPGAPALRYVGLDLDDDLLAVAQERYADDPEVGFLHGDVRDGVPGGPHDLIVSSGVPYSHLLPDELEDALVGMFASARGRTEPTVVVVDVLGRYSIEWTTRWSEQRWSYRMSFFTTDQEPDATDMTVYGGADLRALITRAAGRAGCDLDDVALHDRSIMVGRHTSTGEYTPGLRRYRDLVNDLFDPDVEVALDELRLDVALPDAPDEVARYFASFAQAWNATLDRARRAGAGCDPATVAGRQQPALASELMALERSTQPGLGVGHSLTAVVVTRPAS